MKHKHFLCGGSEVVASELTSARFQSAAQLSPCLLDLDAAAQLLQHKLARVVVDDEHAVLLVRPLVPFEHRHGRRGALQEQQQQQLQRGK